ncbi:hypothetical protein L6452_12769 [Arctium lappa]|uniref:Uncharacterized protein n=1 Tax=Arctium lappa TaxID=4217 RepID=A0ACB9CGC6_ARCLA|nr:hypothetical protein L6452_12769 [Arctium lappa]
MLPKPLSYFFSSSSLLLLRAAPPSTQGIKIQTVECYGLILCPVVDSGLQSCLTVFLKQHLTNVVFDSHFNDEEVAGSVAPLPPSEVKNDDEPVDGNEEESPPVVKRKKKTTSKSHVVDGDEEVPWKKKKKSKSQAVDGDGEGLLSAKRKKAKKSRNVDRDDEESVLVEQEKSKKTKVVEARTGNRRRGQRNRMVKRLMNHDIQEAKKRKIDS